MVARQGVTDAQVAMLCGKISCISLIPPLFKALRLRGW
jgi:hypothetical protein